MTEELKLVHVEIVCQSCGMTLVSGDYPDNPKGPKMDLMSRWCPARGCMKLVDVVMLTHNPQDSPLTITLEPE